MAAPRTDGGDRSVSDERSADVDAAMPNDTSAAVDVDAQIDGNAQIEAQTRDNTAPVTDAGTSAARSDTGSANAAPRESLVLPDYWLLLDAGADPFDDRPAVVDCLPGAAMAETLSEERVLGVQTGWCNYLTAQQATRRALAAGEILKVRLWHFELSAPEPAEAHAALLVDGLRVLDERISIPQPGGLIVKQLRVERDVPSGAPVYFHLHNHGANSWALVEVSVGPSE